MAATYDKIENFVQDVLNKVHDLFGTDPGTDSDVLKVYLSNAAINLAMAEVKADVAEITNENGYTAPVAVTNNGVRAGGTATVSGLSVQVAASGGTVGPFTHVVLYNDTPTSPADPLIAKWSRGSALTLEDGETFDVKFDDAAVGVRGDIFTLA
jgi:hypothetical protein